MSEHDRTIRDLIERELQGGWSWPWCERASVRYSPDWIGSILASQAQGYSHGRDLSRRRRAERYAQPPGLQRPAQRFRGLLRRSCRR